MEKTTPRTLTTQFVFLRRNALRASVCIAMHLFRLNRRYGTVVLCAAGNRTSVGDQHTLVCVCVCVRVCEWFLQLMLQHERCIASASRKS